ncbi:Protein CBG25430 [Caenorhabditis briggsae]|uniref:Protein CBG25430 n=1 Tax=Caenorhabditis briggsae TaxID=6238 RepID=B6ILC3_CAEBR|nr:Protein CBG25430 [Caenorhabditis briggsae]CAS00703.1 Protein CBG25430 [Caenorhabditis briggsae]
MNEDGKPPLPSSPPPEPYEPPRRVNFNLSR